MKITSEVFGKIGEREVRIFTLSNRNGLTAKIMNLGGVIVSLNVPDKNGHFDDIILGYDNLEQYLEKGPYFGAIIGRHANRIEQATFTLNGKEYYLAKNDGNNHLHGGMKGFDKALWDCEIIEKDGIECLQLSYLSKDGEENYPGNLQVKVTYSLADDNALQIEYWAVSDQDTVVNLTNHAYFNLSGHDSGDILKHELLIYADKFTVINDECIPTGEIRSVKNTPMDFTKFKPIGQDIDSKDEQIICGKGYDHNFVLNIPNGELRKAAEVYDPMSGRVMEVYTTKPGMQFYSGNFLDGTERGKGGAVYQKRAGLCLETQYFPNALKHKHFPSPILKAGEEYKHKTIYVFKTR